MAQDANHLEHTGNCTSMFSEMHTVFSSAASSLPTSHRKPNAKRLQTRQTCRLQMAPSPRPPLRAVLPGCRLIPGLIAAGIQPAHPHTASSRRGARGLLLGEQERTSPEIPSKFPECHDPNWVTCQFLKPSLTHDIVLSWAGGQALTHALA